MKVRRASYSPAGDHRLILALGDDHTQIQMDIVGEAAFLFRRVFGLGARVEIFATDDMIEFRRVRAPKTREEIAGATDEEIAAMDPADVEALIKEDLSKKPTSAEKFVEEIEDNMDKLRKNLRRA